MNVHVIDHLVCILVSFDVDLSAAVLTFQKPFQDYKRRVSTEAELKCLRAVGSLEERMRNACNAPNASYVSVVKVKKSVLTALYLLDYNSRQVTLIVVLPLRNSLCVAMYLLGRALVEQWRNFDVCPLDERCQYRVKTLPV